MSRIGSKPVQVPSAVTVQAEGEALVVKGPKGTLRVAVPPGIHFEKQDGQYMAKRERSEQGALHGLARSLLANAVRGLPKALKSTWTLWESDTGRRSKANPWCLPLVIRIPSRCPFRRD